MYLKIIIIHVMVLFMLLSQTCDCYKRKEDKTKCPLVKSIRDFDLHELLGEWYVVQYYSSSEEALAYRCMHGAMTFSPPPPEPRITFNFTYRFIDDPLDDKLIGNITWHVPDPSRPAHWVHTEVTYEGIYNTYVLDSDYKSWALLLHCAEKAGSTRFLSSFVMSREPRPLPANVASYLREKLPRYDIDLEFMFPVQQLDCNVTKPVAESMEPVNPAYLVNASKRRHSNGRKSPLKSIYRRLTRYNYYWGE